MRRTPLLLAVAACLSIAAPAAAEPFVVLQDDGTIEDHALATQSDLNALRTKLLSLYDATGAELPEVLSVWTDFSLGSGYVSTVFDKTGSSVEGIGISKKTSPVPPLDDAPPAPLPAFDPPDPPSPSSPKDRDLPVAEHDSPMTSARVETNTAE